jgi:hypothetical protein
VCDPRRLHTVHTEPELEQEVTDAEEG